MRARLVGAAFLALLAVGCGPTGATSTRTATQELRPTDPGDPRYYGDNVTVDSYASPGGTARVWYAESGPDQPPQADADSDGIPDYVQLVGDTADEIIAKLQADGYKPFTPESSVLNDPASYGGDDLYDVYLKDFGAGDGNFQRDACVAADGAPSVQVCAGYMVLENDFAGLGYSSPQAAERLVLSHESFHAEQAAYNGDYPGWWSEGSAVWFEEHFDASQNDFENLANIYFPSADRTLTDRQRGPSDAFAYGAAIFVYFLDQTQGSDAIKAVMERAGYQEPTVIEAIAGVLSDAGTTFEDAFDEFAVWNAFTGTRAVDGHGYPDAGRFAQVSMDSLDGDRSFDWKVQVSPVATHYAKLTFSRDISLKLAPIDGYGPLTVSAVSAAAFANDGSESRLGTDQAVQLKASDSPVYLVVSNPDFQAEGAMTVKLRKGSANATTNNRTTGTNGSTNGTTGSTDNMTNGPDVQVADTTGGKSGGCSTPGSLAPTAWPLLVLFGLFGLRRRW